MLLEPDGYDCARCPVHTRVERHCPRLAADHTRHWRLRRRTGRWADGTHDDACPRLAYDEVSGDKRLSGWIEDYYLYAAHGTLRRAGGIDDQPIDWMGAIRAIHRAVKDHESELLRRAREDRGADKPTNADPRHRGFAPVQPPYGRRAER